MPIWICACLMAAVIAGCSSSGSEPGHVLVAITVDWEGAYISPEGLDALDELRTKLGAAPFTHFVSAAYLAKTRTDPASLATIALIVRKGDELAVHLHAWKSLATASGVEPKLSPSFLTGTNEILEFDDGDAGLEIDLDAYTVPELRALMHSSRRLLEKTQLPISRSFRIGGYLGTPKVLQAIHDEGYLVDSSAIDSRQLGDQRDAVLASRLKELWPSVDPTTQPFIVTTPGGPLLEMPIAAVTDYTSASEIVRIFESARDRLRKDPRHNVVVVLGFHQETAAEFGSRLGEAIMTVQKRPELASALMFTTVEDAARIVGNGPK